MYYFDGIILVEGKADVCFLSSFINCEYVITNGYDFPLETVDYLQNVKKREIIVLTDPDEAGRKIEEKVKRILPNCRCFCVDINKCDKHGKHGIAECEKDEVIHVLGDILSIEPINKETLSKKDYLELNLITSPVKRTYISSKLHLGTCNSKTLFKRLNYNLYKKEDIINLWK